MDETYYRGADIGQCLSTAYRIEEGNFESWHSKWLKTAQRIHKSADESFLHGHKASARDGYLRDSNYYRAAEFFLYNAKNPSILETWDKSKECFSKAAEYYFLPQSNQ